MHKHHAVRRLHQRGEKKYSANLQQMEKASLKELKLPRQEPETRRYSGRAKEAFARFL